jgi:predicted DNA-binding protein YlxM (UPF0122 family)
MICCGRDVTEIAKELQISRASVYNVARRWATRFMEYERSLSPLKLGSTWQIDDMNRSLADKPSTVSERTLDEPLEVRTQKKKVRRSYWPINVEDEETRYWMSTVVAGRDNPPALEALARAIRLAGKFPDELKGDGYKTHLHAVAVLLPPSSNANFKTKEECFWHINKIERMNRTIRESVGKKAKRFRSLRFLRDVYEIARFHYNFIRPHQALGGRPPAYSAAGATSVFADFQDAVLRLAKKDQQERPQPLKEKPTHLTGQLDDYLFMTSLTAVKAVPAEAQKDPGDSKEEQRKAKASKNTLSTPTSGDSMSEEHDETAAGSP